MFARHNSYRNNMITLNIFNSIEYLEPKCRSVIGYGISTIFNERMLAHVCKCGTVLK